MSVPQHILLLGASSATGLEIIRRHQSLQPKLRPYLTLYVRASGRVKIAAVIPDDANMSTEVSRIRIVEGLLNDSDTVKRALSGDDVFPAATAVISSLGAYLSLKYFFTRNKSTPIADALRTTVIPAMQDLKTRKLMVLSTPCGAPQGTEHKDMSWGWWLTLCMPPMMVPQGNAEMAGIAKAAVEAEGVDYVLVRVPFLSNDQGDLQVVAGYLGKDQFPESKTLSRASLAKWMLNEIVEQRWMHNAPLLVNP